MSTAAEAAGLVRFNMGAMGGLLIAVPIPEANAADGLIVEEAIGKALSEANQQGIRGAHVTPFLLERVNRLTSGASLIASKLMNFHFILLLRIMHCIDGWVVCLSSSQIGPSSRTTLPLEPKLPSNWPSNYRLHHQQRR